LETFCDVDLFEKGAGYREIVEQWIAVCCWGKMGRCQLLKTIWIQIYSHF
jgi:hypothetical protein